VSFYFQGYIGAREVLQLLLIYWLGQCWFVPECCSILDTYV